MSRDPAFLFYDGDAARDVSHMNRLERGAYFDIIQAQRKFHGITMEQIRMVLGKDMESCWNAIKLIMKEENGTYFIEWVRESTEKRAQHCEHQRLNIKKRWDKKKYHGITNVIPLENEIENEIENEDDNKNNNRKIAFESLWSIYPRRLGKKQAEKHFMASVKTPKDWDDIRKALNNYLNNLPKEEKFIKHGSTWFNGWQDWVDYESPKQPMELL